MPRSQPPTLSETRGLTLITTEHTRPVVGIDIGGTKTAASVLTPDGEVGATAQLPTERGTDIVVAALERRKKMTATIRLSVKDLTGRKFSRTRNYRIR